MDTASAQAADTQLSDEAKRLRDYWDERKRRRREQD